jgi:hypothetical protein
MASEERKACADLACGEKLAVGHDAEFPLVQVERVV